MLNTEPGNNQANPKTKKIITKDLKVDSKGRVNLSSLISKHVTKVKATVGKDDNVVLEPYVEIPQREVWVFQNSEVLASIKRGLREAAEGKGEILDLSQFDDIDDEEDN